MNGKIVNKELQYDEKMVHVEFDKGEMKTFVWLSNSWELGYHFEFMQDFFESMEERSIKVNFDLYTEMIVPFIDSYSIEQKTNIIVDKSDKHLFVAMRNKLQKCLDAVNSVQFR
jgi:hypothetical protein